MAGTGVEVTTTSDLDSAIELAEDHLLAGEEVTADRSTLAEIFGADLWEKLEPHLVSFEIEAGGQLIDHGEGSVGLFLVDRGRIVAEIPTGGGRWQRVVSSGPGTILGEMSLYLGTGRTARLRAEEDSCVFTLDAGAIASLEEADPKAAAELHRRLATVLAERLSASNDTVRALLRQLLDAGRLCPRLTLNGRRTLPSTNPRAVTALEVVRLSQSRANRRRFAAAAAA